MGGNPVTYFKYCLCLPPCLLYPLVFSIFLSLYSLSLTHPPHPPYPIMSMWNCKTLCSHGKIDQMSGTVCTCSPRPCWYYILHCLDYLRVCLWICFHSEYVQYVQSNDNSGPNVWGENEEWAVCAKELQASPLETWPGPRFMFHLFRTLHKKSDVYARI